MKSTPIPLSAHKASHRLTGIQEYSKHDAMKATIEVPDELYRRVKAKTALQGRAIREVTVELYQRWLDEGEDAKPAVSAYEMMKEYCGTVNSGIGDLSTNPKRMEGFGDDSTGHR